jgi:hypothetical protein
MAKDPPKLHKLGYVLQGKKKSFVQTQSFPNPSIIFQSLANPPLPTVMLA